ncbi:Uncharacterised protein [Klebsiella grimontii]|uniref:Uncharacterized protein n=1 Tax=Klebsiella grimontii TaxID=2058152 RepID=A0A7H4NV79_9ENTR|nr:Uncharacterised protein [Klebsiella grimontii]
MADNVLNTVIDDFIRHRNGLFRVAGVIVLHGNQLIALDAALGVNIFDRLARAVEFHIAPLGYRARHCANNGDLNIFGKSRLGHRQCD